jgi:hypothetical protein
MEKLVTDALDTTRVVLMRRTNMASRYSAEVLGIADSKYMCFASSVEQGLLKRSPLGFEESIAANVIQDCE